jgi:hypothetical protein
MMTKKTEKRGDVAKYADLAFGRRLATTAMLK